MRQDDTNDSTPQPTKGLAWLNSPAGRAAQRQRKARLRAGRSKGKAGVPAPVGPSAARAGSPPGWGVLRVLERRWRGGHSAGRRIAWWRCRTLASIAVAMTLQGGTVAQLLAMTPQHVAALQDRMPTAARRWVREWLTIRGDTVGPWLSLGRRVLRPAVVRASSWSCGYGLGALLRMRWAG